MKKVIEFAKKNQKVIMILFLVLLLSGMLRRMITGIMLLFVNARGSVEGSEKVDYNFLAMTIHNDFRFQPFDFTDNDNNSVLGIINSLKSSTEFLSLCQVYSIKYKKDLREVIRDKFRDGQYAKLLYK
jgi:hypothetical protein